MILFLKQLQWVVIYFISFFILCFNFLLNIDNSRFAVIISLILFIIFFIKNCKRNKNNDFQKCSQVVNLSKYTIFGILLKQNIDFIYYNFLTNKIIFSIEIFLHIFVFHIIIVFVLYENYKFSIPKK